jgi:hypothetical protein
VYNVLMTPWTIAYAAWTQSAVNDTTDYPQWDHSVAITTKWDWVDAGIRLNLAPTISLTNKTIKIWVKVSDWSLLANAYFLLNNLGLNPMVTPSNIVSYTKHNNEWTPLYFTMNNNTIIWAQLWADVSVFYFKIKDTWVSPVTVKIWGEIEVYDNPTTWSMSIVIDDWWDDSLEFEKIMSKYGIKPTLAIIPDRLNTEWYLTTTQLKDLYRKWCDVILHWDDMSSMTSEQRKNYIKNQRDKLLILGFWNWRHFVYPNWYVDNQLIDDMKDLGFVSWRTINNFCQWVNAKDDFRINSRSVNKNTPVADITDRMLKSRDCGEHFVLTLHKLTTTPTVSTEISIANLNTICQYISDNSIVYKNYSAWAYWV